MASTMLLVAVFIAGVSSYGTGPPDSVCTSLTPNPYSHAASTNNVDPPPYQITVSPATYTAGEDITVTIEQTAVENEFRGFIIQARRKSGDMDAPIGTFKDPPADTKLLTCTSAGSTWIHSAATDKASVTATWTAPSSDEGTLAFRATIVVQNSGGVSTFYENIMSADVAYNDGGAGPTQPPAMMTTGPTEAPGMMTTGNIGTQGMRTDVQETQETQTDEDEDDGEDDDDGRDGAGMVRSSLVVTVLTLLIMVLVVRHL